MFRIKICGVTTIEDAQMVAAYGADAIGLNSKQTARYLSDKLALRIATAVPSALLKVGVFVNAPVEALVRSAQQNGLGLIQLHGDESPKYLSELRSACSLPIVRAFRSGPESLPQSFDYLDRCKQFDLVPDLVLLDACHQGQYGGTGTVADWDVARQYLRRHDLPPLVLAGGLTPLNVFSAIEQVGPAAVDTASGVESTPGVKDPAKVAAFVAAARAAFG